MSFPSVPNTCPSRSIKLPKEVTALSVQPAYPHLLLTASEDRSLRLHDLSSGRPLSAIVNLPDEVAAIVFEPLAGKDGQASTQEGWGAVWIACGTEVHYLRLLPTPFLRPFDQAVERSLTVSEDDVNDLSMTEDGNSLACCSDDGKLAVVNVKTGHIESLRGKHANIAGGIAFLASKPDTLISTSYDSTIKVWTAAGGSLLDTKRLDLPRAPDPLSFTPPMAPSFPVSLATHYSTHLQEPLVCVGTADGAVWLSSLTAGGVVGLSEKDLKKRLKGKWKRDFARIEVAMGPIVGLAFLPPTSPDSLPNLLTCTHLGTITVSSIYLYSREGSSISSPRLRVIRTWETSQVKKCTALAVSEGSVIVGGLGEAGEGWVESWTI